MFILELTNGCPVLNDRGIGIFEYDQAKALSERGNKVVFASLDMRSIRRKRKLGFQKLNADGFDIYNYSFPVGRMPHIFLTYFAWNCFKKIYKRILADHGKPDIIHAHFGLFAGSIALKAKREYGIEYVVTEHDSRIGGDKLKTSQKTILKKVYSDAKTNIAVSQSFYELLTRNYSSKFVYVPNIVDTDSIKFAVGEGDKPLNFLSIGALIPRKGMDVAIKALGVLRGNGYEARLTIIVCGEEQKNLEALVLGLELKEAVDFAGFLPRNKISEYFEKCLCFVLASHCETFGVVCIEAMSAGLPVIATNCGGPENFVNELSGLIVEPGNIEALANAMKYIIDNRDKYCPQKIREYCMSSFSKEIIVEKIENVLKGLTDFPKTK